MNIPNFTCPLHGIGKHSTKFSFSFSKPDTVFSGSTSDNFAKILRIKWNWVRLMKFETVRIDFLSDVFGLLSSRNSAIMATWRNNFLLSIHTGLFAFFFPATGGTATKVTQNDVTIISLHVGITWLTHWRNLTSLWRYIDDVFEKLKFHQFLTISVMSWWRLLLLKNDLEPLAILNPPFWIN